MIENVKAVTEVARGINDYGMMAIAASFFLLLSAIMMVACFKWFKTIIDGIIKNSDAMMKDLLKETRNQNETLSDISEGLKPETQLRIKNISGVYFDLAIEQVCRIIKKIRAENHIADMNATKTKIHTLVRNLHENRNSRFDTFTYRGRKLSEYTNHKWIDEVSIVIEAEIYSESGVNNSRAFTNVSTVYENIKLDFYHRINE